MKGIMKFNKKLYKKSRSKDIKKGDVIKLHCKSDSEYFPYNGIYEVDDYKSIQIKNYREVIVDGETKYTTLCLKLGYNVFDYTKLIETTRKKSLPRCVKEEEY